MNILILVYTFCLGMSTHMIDNSTLIKVTPFYYLSIFLLNLLNVSRKVDAIYHFFKPSTLMISYVSFFFFMGTLAFSLEYVQMDTGDQWKYYTFNNLNIINSFFFFAFFVTFLAETTSNNLANTYLPLNKFESHFIGILLSAILMTISIVVDISLPGGTGSFSSIFFVFASVYIAYALKLNNYHYRYILYFINLSLFALKFYEDRRLLAFYFFILIFIESYNKTKINLKLKHIFLSIVIFVFLISTVIAMSIQRGVGQYDTTNILKAYTFVLDYLNSDWAMTMLFHNLEGPATTFHSYNALDYMINKDKYSYGTTFIKPLFIFVSPKIFLDKPKSMVDEYTSALYPSFRSEGGSYVPNFYSEFYWNFGFWGGLILISPVFYIFNRIYSIVIEKMRKRSHLIDVFFLSTFTFIVFLFRGSGLDLYIVITIVFYFLYVVYCLCLLPLGSLLRYYKSMQR